MNPAPNLILVGPTGAGKTSIGRRVAERFGLAFVDADQAIVERTGASIATLFEHVGDAPEPFPHLYGPLRCSAVVAVDVLPTRR